MNEKRIFTRRAFPVVCNYLLPPYSFQIRVGALYMLYGLYHTQLASPKEKIWVALKDWGSLEKFIQDATSCQHFDVVYVYRKLVSERAIFYCAMPKQLTFQVRRKQLNHEVCEDFRDKPARVAELITTEMLQEISNIQGHYERMKDALCLSSTVRVTQCELAGHLQDCASEFIQWQEQNSKIVEKSKDSTVKETETSQQYESSRRAELLASIKSKSYGHLTQATKSRRHRQVEMSTGGDGSGSGTDNMHEPQVYRRKRPTSLKARTCKNLGGHEEIELIKHWILSSMDEDKTALRRRDQKQRFKW